MKIETSAYEGRLLGLMGYATAGKDTFADGLVERGWKKIGFADPIYDLAIRLNPIIFTPWPKRLEKYVDKVGWTVAKRHKKVREFLQLLGQSIRETVGEDTFVDAAMKRATRAMRNGDSVVITNVRYRNEASRVQAAGGKLLHIERPGIGPVNGHESESGEVFELADMKVRNECTPEELHQIAAATVESLWPKSDKEDLLGVFDRTVRRSILDGIDFALKVAAPASGATQDWVNRHTISIDPYSGDTINILMDGKSIGSIAYSDGVITVDTLIAR